MAFFLRPRTQHSDNVNMFLKFLKGSGLSGPQNRGSPDIRMDSICAPSSCFCLQAALNVSNHKEPRTD